MSVSIIKCIADIAEREKQGDDLIFTDGNGNAMQSSTLMSKMMTSPL
jgi:hypothetical protein